MAINWAYKPTNLHNLDIHIRSLKRRKPTSVGVGLFELNLRQLLLYIFTSCVDGIVMAKLVLYDEEGDRDGGVGFTADNMVVVGCVNGGDEEEAGDDSNGVVDDLRSTTVLVRLSEAAATLSDSGQVATVQVQV
ncbi:hypothetical protein L1987_07015 [Smallanthus sonchifolius]|uniref:Uncharacterized protein n=1 Tax=Smallanthus sonchifolius TaxID=185202 RepID=A0ACB9JZP6_9ASTR|nr:hypothetical protein L1987_07015 [Smallanthus sonchifolius]